METKRFPGLADLQLDPELRRAISEKGGKAGVLHWIGKHAVTLFEDAEGFLMHCDIPYFLYSDGVAIGNRNSVVLTESGKKWRSIGEFLGKEVRLRSDWTYLYVSN